MKVGFIGLGSMGAGMSRNLIKAGNDLVVYNRTRSLAQEMQSLGAKVAETASEESNRGDELTIRSEVSDGQVLISVRDTGPGLPPDQAERVFDPFFTTKGNGTGMGLPISRSIVESHGGRLWATGVSGMGATFQFTLPTPLVAAA